LNCTDLGVLTPFPDIRLQEPSKALSIIVPTNQNTKPHQAVVLLEEIIGFFSSRLERSFVSNNSQSSFEVIVVVNGVRSSINKALLKLSARFSTDILRILQVEKTILKDLDVAAALGISVARGQNILINSPEACVPIREYEALKHSLRDSDFAMALGCLKRKLKSSWPSGALNRFISGKIDAKPLSFPFRLLTRSIARKIVTTLAIVGLQGSVWTDMIGIASFFNADIYWVQVDAARSFSPPASFHALIAVFLHKACLYFSAKRPRRVASSALGVSSSHRRTRVE
jgi:hypothetical protein